MPLLVLKCTMGWYYFPGMKDLANYQSQSSIESARPNLPEASVLGNLTKNL